jgi:hypothetical protein
LSFAVSINRAADEVAQLIVDAQANARGEWLHTLRFVRAKQAAHVKRPPNDDAFCTHDVQERR